MCKEFEFKFRLNKKEISWCLAWWSRAIKSCLYKKETNWYVSYVISFFSFLFFFVLVKSYVISFKSCNIHKRKFYLYTLSKPQIRHLHITFLNYSPLSSYFLLGILRYLYHSAFHVVLVALGWTEWSCHYLFDADLQKWCHSLSPGCKLH